MADKKISALPAATIPLAGTEVLPIVQSGVTDRVSVADLTSGRDVGVKKLNATDNVVIGTAGKGIDFSANTHAAGMVSELLDWYERGNWTPAAGANLTVSGSFTSSGRYVRVGKQVTVTGVLTGSTSVAVNAGGQMCTGLPFVSGVDSVGTATNGSVNASTGIFTPAGVGSILSTDTVGATGSIIFTMSYIVD